MSDKKTPVEDKSRTPKPSQDEPDITMNDAGEGGPGEDPDYDEAGEGDDGIDDRH